MAVLELKTAGPLQRTYFKRHRKRTGSNGAVARRRGSWLFGFYYCTKCGKRMTR